MHALVRQGLRPDVPRARGRELRQKVLPEELRLLGQPQPRAQFPGAQPLIQQRNAWLSRLKRRDHKNYN